MTESEIVERAKQEAANFRTGKPIPIRVFERDGLIIWSKVDDRNCDLTTANSDGMLYHIRSLFAPHGHPNAIEAQAARIAEAEAECLEQSRIIGKGAERELALQARVAELEARIARLREALRRMVNIG